MKRALCLLALLLWASVASAQMAGGVMESQRQGNAAVTSGTITGITDLAVADGGTGASTAQNAAANLGTSYVLYRSTVAVNTPADATEDVLHTITIPANAMGPNGIVRLTVTFDITNSANAKTPRVRYSGAAGTVLYSAGWTAAAYPTYTIYLANRNATNAQIAVPMVSYSAAAVSGTAVTTAADTLAGATTLVISCQKATAGELCGTIYVLAELLYGG